MAETVSPILSVLPTRGLVDEKFQVVARNLPPGLPVTFHSLHQSEDKNYWEAYGHYVCGDRGTVTGELAQFCSQPAGSLYLRTTEDVEKQKKFKYYFIKCFKSHFVRNEFMLLIITLDNRIVHPDILKTGTMIMISDVVPNSAFG